MAGELLVALDLGTTGVRALVVRRDGSVAARAYRSLGARFPRPGWVEQDPLELWDESMAVVREALAGASAPAASVAALGVVTQRATAIAWDAGSGQPLAPAIGWQDLRTAERVAPLREFGLSTLASATKFEWLLSHVDAVARAARSGTLRLGTPDAWLAWQLTGGEAFVTDPGNASCTALYDLAGGAWSAGLLELFGLHADLLPELAPTSGVLGETPSALFGAPVAVAALAGDQQAACFAQSVHGPGEAKLTLGTSGMLDLCTGAAPADSPRGAHALALWQLASGARAFCVEGSVLTAGATVDWLVELGLAPDAAGLERLARSVPSRSGVSFVPALAGLGTPFMDDAARGLVLGLTRGTGAAELARAAFEGIAQRCVDLCDALDVPSRPLRVDGGLAQSELLLQSLADLSGREVLRAAETETTALGAAFLAGLAIGVLKDPSVCAGLVEPAVRLSPRSDRAARERARAEWSDALERARSAAPDAD